MSEKKIKNKDLTNEDVIHVVKDGIQFLQFKKLLKYNKEINHAYSLGLDTDFRTIKVKKNADDSQFEEITNLEYEHAIQSYKNLCEKYNVSNDNKKSQYINLVKPNLRHTNNVANVEQKINNNEPDFNLEIYKKTDGLITDKKNIILSTTNADCIIFMFYDVKNKVIANVHSGWRGTLKRISVKTVEKMIKDYNSNPDDIICAICPAIRKCHFEVNDDVRIPYEEEFEKELSMIKSESIKEYEKIISRNKKDKEKWNIDTIELNKIILKNIGLKPENILDSKICSMCDSDIIHSCRVEKEKYKLNTALIELK